MKPMHVLATLLVATLAACGRPAPLPEVPVATVQAASTTGNPVICVPGFGEPAVMWSAIVGHLRAKRRDVTMLALFPHLGSVESSAEKLAATVAKVRKRTGAKRVDLLGHSKGGLVARYYLRFDGGTEHVERLVTIASPNHGVLVPLPAFWRTIKQVRWGTAWMKALNEPDETPGAVKYTTMVGALDTVVVPHSSSLLEGAKNHTVLTAGHNSIMFSLTAIAMIDEALAR